MVMTAMAIGLSDTDIANLSAYYASLNSARK
jgi:cytochrome c553